jgi:hypothetical protein
MAQTSRLLQYERRRAVRTAIVYLALISAFLFLLSRFGTDFITSFTGVVDRNVQESSDDTVSLVPAPDLDLLPEVTNQKIITLSGHSEPGGVVRLWLNGETRDIIANSGGAFSTEFNLHEAENIAIVRAVDNKGNTSRETSTRVVLDTTAPKLELHSPENNTTQSGKKNQSVTVSGTTDPDASVRVNDRVAIISSAGDFSLSFNLNEGDNTFTITATDQAGNKTEETRTVTFHQ